MAAALRFSSPVNRFGASQTLDVFEDETTIPRRKKRRSSARRVSFAETQTVHVFQRDDEYATPPGAVTEIPKPGFVKDQAGVDGDIDTGSSTEKNAVAYAGPEVGEEAAGPVDINHITDVSPESPAGDDVTLDSTTFSAKFIKFASKDGEEEACKADDNFSFHNEGGGQSLETGGLSKRSGSWECDMSFTVQNPNPRRQVPTPGVSPPASHDRSVTMQYTEVVDASTLAQRRRRRVFRASPHLKGNENFTPERVLENVAPKRLKLGSTEKQKSPLRHRKPLQDISMLQQNAESRQMHVVELSSGCVRNDETESCCSKDLDRSLSETSFRRDDEARKVLPSLDFLLDDSHSEISGRTTPIPTLGSLLDRDTCTVDTTFMVRNVSGDDITPVKTPSEPDRGQLPETDKRRQEQLQWLQSKLEVSNEKSSRLESRKNLLVRQAEATRKSYETLKLLYNRSCKLEASISEWNVSQNNEVLLEQELTAMQKESQQMQARIKSMKENLRNLNEKILELSSVSEACKFEQSKARFYQKLQGWHVTRVINKGDFYRLDISYGCRVNQSITVEGKGSQTSVWTHLIPDVHFIEKGFPHMNARILFQALLPGDRVKLNNLKKLPTVLRQTSDLVMNLIQVAKEAGDCRVSHRCLQSVVFVNNTDHGICMQLLFENYKMRCKISLLFRLQVLSSGEYPKDIVPYDITVESTRRTQCMISELDVSKAICSIPAGHERFHRICECVATFLP